jgi:hypothetical protein
VSNHRLSVAACAILLAVAHPSPARGQASAEGTSAPGAQAEPLMLCVSDPLASRRLRTVEVVVDAESGDTFAVEGDDTLPLAMLFPPGRNYARGRGWFVSDAPVAFAGRGFRKDGAPASVPADALRPAGVFGDTWIFRRATAGEEDRIYVPTGPGCEFQAYRTEDPPAPRTRLVRSRPPRHFSLSYATNRGASDNPRPGRHYGFGSGPLEIGTAEVDVPPGHHLGRMESRFLRGGGSDTLAHVTLHRVTVPGAEAAPVPGRAALLYIHGFNTSFEYAARRTAQLAHDLDFDGDVYFFSWPSRGAATGYIGDLTTVERSRPEFMAALEAVVRRHGEGKVSVVVHSLGARGFAPAAFTASAPSTRSAKRLKFSANSPASLRGRPPHQRGLLVEGGGLGPGVARDQHLGRGTPGTAGGHREAEERHRGVSTPSSSPASAARTMARV